MGEPTLTRNPYDALCCESPKPPRYKDAEIEAAIKRAREAWVMPHLGDEVWTASGKISNGEWSV